MRKKVFVGTCIDTLDRGCDYFSDATQMAQVVECGVEISKERFLENCHLRDTKRIKGDSEFWYNGRHDLYWIHNKETDTHYFYG